MSRQKPPLLASVVFYSFSFISLLFLWLFICPSPTNRCWMTQLLRAPVIHTHTFYTCSAILKYDPTPHLVKNTLCDGKGTCPQCLCKYSMCVCRCECLSKLNRYRVQHAIPKTACFPPTELKLCSLLGAVLRDRSCGECHGFLRNIPTMPCILYKPHL